MQQATLFANEYRELLAVAPDAAAYAAERAGGWTLTLPEDARASLAGRVERAVAQAERDWLALGRQIWLSRPQMTDAAYAAMEAEHGAAERRHRILSRVLAALLDAAAS